MQCIFQTGTFYALVSHHYLRVLQNSRKNAEIRTEHAFLPPKALHLLMFLSVSNFLARLRKFLLTFHPKGPFSRPTFGSLHRDKYSPDRFAWTRRLQGKDLHAFPEYSNIFSALGVAEWDNLIMINVPQIQIFKIRKAMKRRYCK